MWLISLCIDQSKHRVEKGAKGVLITPQEILLKIIWEGNNKLNYIVINVKH